LKNHDEATKLMTRLAYGTNILSTSTGVSLLAAPNFDGYAVTGTPGSVSIFPAHEIGQALNAFIKAANDAGGKVLINQYGIKAALSGERVPDSR
jgi:phosphoribosylcarboxyaminoimidazole (NCAIR) mutase